MPSTRRCWFVGCDVTSKNKAADISLVLLPKKEPARTTWWLNMGHRRSSLPAPSNAHCCSLHIDTRLPRKVWTPVPGIANVFNVSSGRPTVSRDADIVESRRVESLEQRRRDKRIARIKTVEREMTTNPKVMAEKFVKIEEQVQSNKRAHQSSMARAQSLADKLEGMAPSKLSTLTDDWVSAFTPFRSKVTLTGFLVTMVMPNLEHVWGYAGFKDQFDLLRRQQDATVRDDRFDTSAGRVQNNFLEKERNRLHRVQARQIKRRKERTTDAQCSYAGCNGCKHPNDVLHPCENPGLCPNFTHERCSRGGQLLLCYACASKVNDGNNSRDNSQRKRDRELTPTDIARSVSKTSKISKTDTVITTLFPDEHITWKYEGGTDEAAWGEVGDVSVLCLYARVCE